MIEQFGTSDVYSNLGKALNNDIPIPEKTVILGIIRQLSSFPSQRKILRNSSILPLICKFMSEEDNIPHLELMANSFRTIYYLMKDDGMNVDNIG
jgi:hypothetical protein